MLFIVCVRSVRKMLFRCRFVSNLWRFKVKFRPNLALFDPCKVYGMGGRNVWVNFSSLTRTKHFIYIRRLMLRALSQDFSNRLKSVTDKPKDLLSSYYRWATLQNKS